MYRVFLIDDEPWVLISLQRLIDWEALGFQVIGTSTSAASALAQIREKRPDAVFTDIRMPGLSGLELLQKIRDEKLGMQVVLISGFAEFTYAREALQNGAFDYLLKQVKREQLTDCLVRLKAVLDGTGEDREENKEESPHPQESQSEEERLFSQVLEQIDLHFADGQTAASLARAFCMSQGTLSKLIKKHANKTYSELVQERRMDRAKELLVTTDLTLVEIAEKTGYADQFYLSKLFKRVNGISPNAYRKLNKKG